MFLGFQTSSVPVFQDISQGLYLEEVICSLICLAQLFQSSGYSNYTRNFHDIRENLAM
jgi:hypothetical protein